MTARRRSVLGVGAWIALIVLARWWGTARFGDGEEIKLTAVPMAGHWDPLVSGRILPAAVLAALVVAFGPRLAARLPWPAVLGLAALVAAGWAAALAVIEAPTALVDPLQRRYEYLSLAPRVGDLGRFVDTFVDRRPGYPLYVKGSPPGMVMVLAGLDRIGLGGAGWAAGLVIGGGSAAVVAVLATLRELAGTARARAAAPFLATLPAAMYVASTSDAFFAGVGLTGVALVAIATGRHDWRGDASALTGGVLLGVAVHLSYGLVLLGVPALVVGLGRRRVRPLVVGALGALAVLAAFLAAGFWWVEGLEGTRSSYRGGVASVRPYGYFALGNLAALALVLGPAVAAGLARLAHRGAWMLVGAAVAAVALADLSGLSKGEVERIWLFMAIPMAASTAALGVRRGWLTLHVVAGIVLQVWLRTVW